jgi:hypothetical protein
LLILAQTVGLLVGGEIVVRRAFAAQGAASTASLTVFLGAKQGAADRMFELLRPSSSPPSLPCCGTGGDRAH